MWESSIEEAAFALQLLKVGRVVSESWSEGIVLK